jgi:NADPH:quinone reductase-like Zn-dependent oxidoreductase
VIAVASGSERQARLGGLGASHVIDRQETDVTEEVLRLTGGRGANLVIDPVGSTLQASLSALAPRFTRSISRRSEFPTCLPATVSIFHSSGRGLLLLLATIKTLNQHFGEDADLS